jgi:hypothetical protein
VLLYKRLEKGRFRIPRVKPGATRVVLDATELAMLLIARPRSLSTGPTSFPSNCSWFLNSSSFVKGMTLTNYV